MLKRVNKGGIENHVINAVLEFYYGTKNYHKVKDGNEWREYFPIKRIFMQAFF